MLRSSLSSVLRGCARPVVAATPMRSLAAKSGAAEMESGVRTIQAPVRLHGLTGRYATALYSAASGAKGPGAEKVEAELKDLTAALSSNGNLSKFMFDPSIPRQEKTSFITQLAGKAKYSDITKNFLELLAENGRMNVAPKIIDTYGEIMAAHRKEVSAVVTTATPLEKNELEDVRAALGGLIGKDQKLVLETRVDESILGGLVVSYGDKYIDLSVQTRIQQMRRLLM